MALCATLRSPMGSCWLPTAFTRCLSTTQTLADKQHYKLVVVGNGAGGSSTAHMFSRTLGAENVVLIDDAQTHYYQPGFTMVGGGIKTFEEVQRKTTELLPAGVKWLQDTAETFDPKNDSLTTKAGHEVTYDYLVMACGIQLRFDKIKGAVDALENQANVCSNYSPKYVRKTYPAFKAFKNGQTAIFTFPVGPIKCAGAPQKIAYLFDEYCRKHDKRSQSTIMYNTALPRMFGVLHYAEPLLELAKRKEFQLNFRHNLVEVKADTSEAVFDVLDEDNKPISQQIFKYDFLHIGSPCSPQPALVAAPKDFVDAVGFVTVKRDTLQHVNYPNVFAIGDCSSAPTAKTAAAVAAQSGILLKNLTAVMDGKQPEATYDGYTSCPLVTGYSKVMLAEFDYDLKPLETLPIDQRKERWLSFVLKNNVMPPLYWNKLVRGTWRGPAAVRKLLHLGMGK